jgi:glycerol-3-phosphate acyltransferase PlsY
VKWVILKAASFFILSYLIGGIPTGYLLVKLVKHVDIRTQGSGNIGFSNVMRSAGVFPGIAVLIIDAGKAFLAVRYFPSLFEQEPLFRLIFGCAVIAGNILNPFLGLRGGKGVGTGLGACLAVSPTALLCALLFFGCALALTRYISLSSLAAAVVFLLVNGLLFNRGKVDLTALVFAALLFAAVSARHVSNIKRLIRGEENRIGKRR